MSETTPTPAAGQDVAGELVNSLVVASKGWLRSKTIIGLIITGVALAAQNLFGLTVSAETAASVAGSVVDLLCYFLEAGGIALAAYGRRVATGPLKGGEETAAKAIAKATALVLVLSLFLAGPAHAGDDSGASLITLSLWPMLINLAYLAIALLAAGLLWFLVVDKLILPKINTAKEIAKDPRAVADFAGKAFLGICILFGLVLG